MKTTKSIFMKFETGESYNICLHFAVLVKIRQMICESTYGCFCMYLKNNSLNICESEMCRA